MDATLKEQICNLISDEYKKLKQSSKPVIRSNGKKEWTVLASIVKWDNKTNETRILSLSTGVKALPDETLQRSSGKMVHDCHAEILAIRGFNSVILQHMGFLKEGKSSDLIEEKEGKYTWKENNQLVLYISRMPCGDASMDSLEESEDTNENFQIANDADQQYIKDDIKTTIRGRLNFSKKGIVRTKPGRIDSNITLSKSCSDKLCVKQISSILNSLTFGLFNEPVYLDYLLIPMLKESDLRGLKRCFTTRLVCHNNKGKESDDFPLHPFVIESTDQCFIDDKKSAAEDPSAMSSVKLYFSSSDTIEQAILNGVRNGFYTKGNKRLRKNCEAIVSRYSQWTLFQTLFPSHEKSYLAHKATQKARNELISKARVRLSPDGWIHTLPDDCVL